MQYPPRDNQNRTVKVKTVPMDALLPSPASTTNQAEPLDYYGRILAKFASIKLEFAGRLSAIEEANHEREQTAELEYRKHLGQEASARRELAKVEQGHDQTAVDLAGNAVKHAILDAALAKVKVKEAALESEKARQQHFFTCGRRSLTCTC